MIDPLKVDNLGSPVMVKYLDHCSEEAERTLKEISENPLTPVHCTTVGFLTHVDREFVTVSSELTDHGEDSEDRYTYSNHTSIIRETVLECRLLTD